MANIEELKDTPRNSRYRFLRTPPELKRSHRKRALALRCRAYLAHLGPESVGKRLFDYLRDWPGFVDFPTVRTAEAAPPHSVDESQRQIRHEEDDNAKNGRVGIDDEDEVV